MGSSRASLEYLIASSQMSLESMELSRLNLASNLRKEILQILEEWIDSEVDARLARSILEWRRARASGSRGGSPAELAPVYLDQLSSAFLPSLNEATREPSAAKPCFPCSQLQTSSTRAEKPGQETPSEDLAHSADAALSENPADRCVDRAAEHDADRALGDSGIDATASDPCLTRSVSLARAAAMQDRGADVLAQRRECEFHSTVPSCDTYGATRGTGPCPLSVGHFHHLYVRRTAS